MHMHKHLVPNMLAWRRLLWSQNYKYSNTARNVNAMTFICYVLGDNESLSPVGSQLNDFAIIVSVRNRRKHAPVILTFLPFIP